MRLVRHGWQRALSLLDDRVLGDGPSTQEKHRMQHKTTGARLTTHQRPSKGKRALRGRATYKETGDVVKATSRLVLAVGKRIAVEDPADLAHILALEAKVTEAKDIAVRGLQRTGYSNREIGDVLGVTRQRVTQRWPRPDDCHRPRGTTRATGHGYGARYASGGR